MRPQHNNKRGRGRNRRHNGGNMGGGGGNSNNRVLDSNGPDVKLRGTAQTIAEKYMQLARDAASSGDTVMAESYFQHADHYYRVWLAAQPPGQPLQFSRRLAEEELADDEADAVEGEGEDEGTEGEIAEGTEVTASVEGQGEGAEAPLNGEGQPQQRSFRQREPREGREGQRERFRPRWPRRGDRYENREQGNGQYAEAPTEGGERQERPERPERSERYERQDRPERFERRERQAAEPREEERGEERGDWEAPSFLKRPLPATSEASTVSDAPPAEPQRRPRGRRPRYGDEQAPETTPPATEE